MAAALAEKNTQLLQIEKNNRIEMMRVSAEAAEKFEFLKKVHKEAMEETSKQIQDLEKNQEDYLKIIEKKKL